MKDTICQFNVSGSLSDEYTYSLIKVTAECVDCRTDDCVPLTFYFLRRMDLSAITDETLQHMISLTIVNYGFVFSQIVKVEKAQISMNAQLLWKEQHEQKALPF